MLQMGKNLYSYDAIPAQVGGKGSSLVRMKDLGLNVPDFGIITTAYHHSLKTHTISPDEWESGNSYWFDELDSTIRYHFNNSTLFSVRSGAKVSMPGMMDTILNVGIDNENWDSLCSKYGKTLCYDLRARLTRQWSTFEGMDDALFAEAKNHVDVFYVIDGEKNSLVYNRALDEAYTKVRNKPLPTRKAQLHKAICWVWESFDSDRAKVYREINGLDDVDATAVVVQKMVYGNLNDRSATGVIFSCDPNTGEDKIVANVLIGGQGEEVVSGAVNTMNWEEFCESELATTTTTVASLTYNLQRISDYHDGDPVDVEFTIQDGQLWFLQARKAKLSTRAKIRHIMEQPLNMEDKVDSILNTLPDNQITTEVIDGALVSTGVGATEGTASGKIATSHEAANTLFEAGVPFIFVAEETSPMDILPMSQSIGILTMKGGALSHAAIIAREWGKPAVVGCSELYIDEDDTLCDKSGTMHTAISINGKTGEVNAYSEMS